MGILRGMHLGSSIGTGRKECIVKPMLLSRLDHHQAFAVEILPFQFPFSRQTVTGGRGEDLRQLINKPPFQFGKIDWRSQQSEIQFAGTQAPQLFGARQFHQRELHAGKALMKMPQHIGQPGTGRRRNDAQA